MSQTSVIVASIAVILVLFILYGYLYLSERKRYIIVLLYSLVTFLAAYLTRLAIMNLEQENSYLLITNFVSTMTGYWLTYKAIAMLFEKKQHVLWDVFFGLLALLFIVLKMNGLPVLVITLLSVFYTMVIIYQAGFIAMRARKPEGSS